MNKNKKSLALLLLLSGSQLVALNKTIDLNYSADRSKQFVHIKNPERESLIRLIMNIYMGVCRDAGLDGRPFVYDPTGGVHGWHFVKKYSNTIAKLFECVTDDDLKEADEAFNSLLADQELRTNPLKYAGAIAKLKEVVWSCLSKVWIRTSPHLIRDFCEAFKLEGETFCPPETAPVEIKSLYNVAMFIYLLNLSENPLGLLNLIADAWGVAYNRYYENKPYFFLCAFDDLRDLAKKVFPHCGVDPKSIYPTEEKI